MLKLTPQQVSFFNTFGFIVLPQLLKDDIDWITDEFAMVFTDKGVVHDPTRRTVIVPFVDSREKLCALLDHPAVEGSIASLIGDDFNYVGSDGNYYSGDTGWHSDGQHTIGLYIKMAVYLDPVDKDTGCLRVIPGTHRVNAEPVWDARSATKAKEIWDTDPRDVPCFPLVSRPGDAVIFNHSLFHSAFGGSNCRRMFTLNCGSRARTPEEVEELRKYMTDNLRPWGKRAHSETMRSTAGPGRMIHLSQVIGEEATLNS